jgi:hypothetical protein
MELRDLNYVGKLTWILISVIYNVFIIDCEEAIKKIWLKNQKTPKYTLINKISMSCIIYTQIYFQPTAQHSWCYYMFQPRAAAIFMELRLTIVASVHVSDGRSSTRQIFLDKKTRTYTCRYCSSPAYLASLNILLLCHTYIWCDNTCCSYSLSDVYGEIQRSFKWKAENLCKIRNMKEHVITLRV